MECVLKITEFVLQRILYEEKVSGCLALLHSHRERKESRTEKTTETGLFSDVGCQKEDVSMVANRPIEIGNCSFSTGVANPSIPGDTVADVSDRTAKKNEASSSHPDSSLVSVSIKVVPIYYEMTRRR